MYQYSATIWPSETTLIEDLKNGGQVTNDILSQNPQHPQPCPGPGGVAANTEYGSKEGLSAFC